MYMWYVHHNYSYNTRTCYPDLSTKCNCFFIYNTASNGELKLDVDVLFLEFKVSYYIYLSSVEICILFIEQAHIFIK